MLIMKRIYGFIVAVVMSSISLSAMEEKELVVALGKSEEATQNLHAVLDKTVDSAFQSVQLYKKIEQLLKKRADPNGKGRGRGTFLRKSLFLRRLSFYGNRGRYDCNHKRVPASLIPLLLEYGAEIDKKSGEDKTNALHVAVRHSDLSNYEKACMLLQCGADVNCKDGNGKTPLHLRKITPYQDRGFVKLLLIYGADPFIKDANDRDAFEFLGLKEDPEKRRSECLVLHAKAQELLKLKAAKEKEDVPQKEIIEMFEKEGFPYPYRGVPVDKWCGQVGGELVHLVRR